MAKSGTFGVSVTWSGGTAEIRWRSSTNSGANQSTVTVELWAHTSGFTTFGSGSFVLRIGNDASVSVSNISISGSWVKVVSRSRTVTHNADGSLSIAVGVVSGGLSGTSWTNTSGTRTVALDDFVRTPAAVAGRTTSDITPTGAVAAWSAPSSPAGSILEYQVRLRRMTDNVDTDYSTGTTRSKTFTGLLPGTNYGWLARARNVDGWGPWSTSYATFTTLPSSPPTLTSVTPDATGRQATVVVAPPAGISSVNSYTIERRTPGGAWTTAASGSANISQVVTGLTPGATYEWRTTATIGTYVTPVSNSITATQPQPNASPGAYFDGNTPDVPGTNYGWTGTAGASTSTATTTTGGAVGWLSGAEAVVDSGGTAAQYQVSGGLEPNGNSGAYAVRYAILTPADDNGFRAGTDGDDGYAVTTVGGQYMGSIWAMPNRDRTLAAMIVWYDVAGNEVGTTLGSAIPAYTDTPVRLSVLGAAPAGAVRMAVVATDPPGSPTFTSGDLLDVDAAMASTGTLYPYFDGDTADTTQFIYDWEAGQFTSRSFRETIPQAAQNPLQDPNCDPLPTPPSPPPIPDDCIIPVGSWRRIWYTVDAANVPEYLTAAPSVTLTTFGEAEQQVRIRWYANPDCDAPLDFDSSSWQYEQIISYIPPNSTVYLDGVSRHVWAQVPTGTGNIAADSLLYGTGGVPATWPLISCGGCWLVSLDTALDSTVGNLSATAGLTVRE